MPSKLDVEGSSPFSRSWSRQRCSARIEEFLDKKPSAGWQIDSPVAVGRNSENLIRCPQSEQVGQKPYVIAVELHARCPQLHRQKIARGCS